MGFDMVLNQAVGCRFSTQDPDPLHEANRQLRLRNCPVPISYNQLILTVPNRLGYSRTNCSYPSLLVCVDDGSCLAPVKGPCLRKSAAACLFTLIIIRSFLLGLSTRLLFEKTAANANREKLSNGLLLV